MRLDVFLTLYKSKRTDEAKHDFFMERLKSGYIPIGEKRKYAEKVADASFKTADDGTLDVDSFGRYIEMNMTMMEAFTDVERPTGEGVEAAFDKLNEAGFFRHIIENADPTEMAEF